MAAPANVTTKNAASNAQLPGQWSTQNLLKTKWMVIEVTKVTTGIGIASGTTYSYKYWIYNNDNSLDTSSNIGSDIVAPVLGSTQAWRDGAAKNQTNYKKAVALLKEFATDATSQYNQATDAPINVDTPLGTKEVESVKFNPPPHKATRSPSFYAMANIPKDFKGSAKSILDQYKASSATGLGKIYQTNSTAKALNKRYLSSAAAKNQHLSDLETNSFIAGLKSGTSVWGFRFIYNPTSISYSNQVDTSIDWIQNVQDPSRFFGGNVSISFDLYLNRIADLASLEYKNGGVVGNSKNYPGYNLRDDHINGIYYRGTEYDLEYLYRCVNGDPTKTSLTTQKLSTSDFGYITGSPLWLQFHDNLRYKASLANISVDHVLFSDRMVPMLSVVRLSFIRYPELEALGDNEAARLEALKSFQSNGQSSEPTPGKTGA